MQYSAHDAYIAPARARPEIWRILVGFLLIIAVYFGFILALFLVLALIAGPDGAEIWMARMVEATGPTGTLLLLATFVGMAAGPIVAALVLHKRGALTLLGPIPRTLRHFLVATGICALIYAAAFQLPSDIQPVEALSWRLWLSFLPLALVAVLVQTGAEEILFRGYLQQQLAARFRSPLVWMLLPSVLFALAHYQPDVMGGNAWLVVGAVGLFAVLAADLTAKTGSLGAAWGFHFANNVSAILVVSIDGPLSGLALYTLPITGDDPALASDLLLGMGLTLGTWLAIRLAVSRV